MSKRVELEHAALAYAAAHKRHVEERNYNADEAERAALKQLREAALAFGEAVARA